MIRYALRRLLWLGPVLLGVSMLVFLLLELIPGDPALAILGPYATPESLAEVRSRMGLDRGPVERYLAWLGGVLRGDLGRAHSINRPVLDEVAERLGPSLLLAGAAFLAASILGLAAGAKAAAERGRWTDRLLSGAAMAGICLPSFWLAVLLLFTFAVRLGWLPAGGMTAVYGGGGPGDVLAHLVLPAAALALVAMGPIARHTRAAMIEEMGQDYVRMALAKGLSERAVLLRHAFLNAFSRVLPVLGLQAGFVLSGAVYVETVFQWPGLGRMLVLAVASRDILLVQGGALVAAGTYVVLNLAVDLAQAWLDPRIQL